MKNQLHLTLVLMLTCWVTLTNLLHADQIDDYVKQQMKQRHIPGLSLAIVKNSKIIKAKGYGLANVELNVPATKDQKLTIIVLANMHEVPTWDIVVGIRHFFLPDVLADPVRAADDAEFDTNECEDMLYVAIAAYKSKTGNYPPKSDIPLAREPAGEKWEVADLKSLYPELCERFP